MRSTGRSTPYIHRQVDATKQQGEATRPRIAVAVLGPFELAVDGRAVDVQRPQVRLLLSAFALHRGRRVHPDRLIDVLWHDAPPASPRRALNVVLSRLRATLGERADLLSTEADGYRLDIDALDVTTFVELIDAAREMGDDDAMVALEQALALWRGEPFAGDDSDAAIQQRAGLVQRHAALAIDLAALWCRQGRAGDAGALVGPLAQADLLDEGLASSHATALALQGRKADALRVVGRTIGAIRSELGLEPSRVLVDLEHSILDGTVELRGHQSGLEPLPAVGFVGRVGQLELLTALPLARPVVLTGESGRGKSTLLDEVARTASAAGVWVGRAVVDPAAETPMSALAQLCRSIAVSTDDTARSDPAFARICPDLAPAGALAALTRDALVEGASSWMAAHATGGLLLVDDAQWADAVTIEVLARVIEKGAVSLVVALRPDPDVLAELVRSPEAVDALELPALALDDVIALVEQACPGRNAADVAAAVWERSGGNALFVRLLVDRWAEGADLAGELPTSVLIAVRDRLDRLSQRALDTLQMAAVIGTEFDELVLRRLRRTAEADLEEIGRAGLLVASERAGRIAFAHDLVAQACYELIPAGIRTGLHDQVATVLRGDPTATAELARHGLVAVELDPRRALDALLLASGEAAAGFDWPTVRALLDSAYEVATTYDLADSDLSAELRLRRGIAGRALGEAYVADLVAAARSAATNSNDEMLVIAMTELCSHGRTTAVLDVDPDIRALLDRGLTAEVDPALRIELCASAGTMLAHTDDEAFGRALYHEAVRGLGAVDDPELESAVLSHAHRGLAHADDFDLLRAGALRLARLAGDDAGLAWEAEFLRFQSSAVLGDAADAWRSLRSMRELAPRVLDRSRDFGMAFSEASWAQLTGDPAAAESHADRVLQIGVERYPDGLGMNTYATLLVGIRNDQGRLGELFELCAALAESRPTFMPYAAATAAAAHAAGRCDAASSMLAVVWSIAPDERRAQALWAAFATLLAPAVAAHGTPAEIAELRAELEPRAGRLSWNGVSTFGPVDTGLAMLAAAQGDTAAAERHRAAACAILAPFRAGDV